MKKYLVTSTNEIKADKSGNISLLDNTIEGTYEEIKTLRDNSELRPNTRYIITDYQTKYYILGSNSSGIIKEGEITSVVGNFAVIYNNYVNDLPVGKEVTITKLPLSYTGALTIGSKTTVSRNASNYYFEFANGMHTIIGLEFIYYNTRYQSIPADSIILDNNDKPVIIPRGIINTEVHDGLPYMDQTSLENLAVPIERIVLSSSTSNTFAIEAYSDTFIGDKIWYDIDSTEIKNDNKQVIGSRNGLIKRRYNDELSIDMDSDWRVSRYRRWLLDPESRTKFINKDLDLTTKVAYQSKFLYTSRRRLSTDTTPFYIAWKPEGSMANLDKNAMRVDFSYNVVSNQSAKDFNIFPLDAEYNPINVQKLIVSKCYNTVFFGLPGEFNFDIVIDGGNDGSINYSTFISNPQIIYCVRSKIDSCIFLDSASIAISFSDLINSNFLSYFNTPKLVNSSITRAILGTVTENISGNNSLSSTGTNVIYSALVSWNIITLISSNINDSVIGQKEGGFSLNNTVFHNSSLFINITSGEIDDEQLRKRVSIHDCVFSRVGLLIPRILNGISFTNLLFQDKNPIRTDGYYFYNVGTGFWIVKKNIKLHDTNFKLYYENLDDLDVLTRPQFAMLGQSVPGTPKIGTAVKGNTLATVSYTAPALNNGSVITSYIATSTPGGITGTISQAGSGSITVSGLTNGVSYTFTVQAVNSIGTSPASASSNAVTPSV
jgi:hypothetical protein